MKKWVLAENDSVFKDIGEVELVDGAGLLRYLQLAFNDCLDPVEGITCLFPAKFRLTLHIFQSTIPLLFIHFSYLGHFIIYPLTCLLLLLVSTCCKMIIDIFKIQFKDQTQYAINSLLFLFHLLFIHLVIPQSDHYFNLLEIVLIGGFGNNIYSKCRIYHSISFFLLNLLRHIYRPISKFVRLS